MLSCRVIGHRSKVNKGCAELFSARFHLLVSIFRHRIAQIKISVGGIITILSQLRAALRPLECADGYIQVRT